MSGDTHPSSEFWSLNLLPSRDTKSAYWISFYLFPPEQLYFLQILKGRWKKIKVKIPEIFQTNLI